MECALTKDVELVLRPPIVDGIDLDPLIRPDADGPSNRVKQVS